VKILVTGASGYIGTIVSRYLAERHNLIKTNKVGSVNAAQISCDLTNSDAVRSLAMLTTPEVVIHVAGNKNIAFCEEHPDDAFQINCNAVKNVAEAFGSTSRIFYLSTDYVFDGIQGGYKENDIPSPQTVYGKSKLCGETEGRRIAGSNFVTIRLSALYDDAAAFPQFIKEKLSQGQSIDCFTDVIYSPTYYQDLLAAIDTLLYDQSLTGPVYHICGEATSRYNFAFIYAEVFGLETRLVKKTSAVNGGKYLFPNLSLNCDWSLETFKFRSTGIREALTKLKKENR
jgi:dTDP-4-dehydrorhamnose reductase